MDQGGLVSRHPSISPYFFVRRAAAGRDPPGSPQTREWAYYRAATKSSSPTRIPANSFPRSARLLSAQIAVRDDCAAKQLELGRGGAGVGEALLGWRSVWTYDVNGRRHHLVQPLLRSGLGDHPDRAPQAVADRVVR